MTQYGGVVPHLRVGVLEVVDEDGGEAPHHPDADVEEEKWKEAQKLASKSFLLTHYCSTDSRHFIKCARFNSLW